MGSVLETYGNIPGGTMGEKGPKLMSNVMSFSDKSPLSVGTAAAVQSLIF